MTAPGPWIRAADAAAMLRVNRATLYAYVSRGLIRSQPMPGSSRERGYSREDVERLQRRAEERRDPDKAAARALQWGVPVLESAITLIDGNRLYYRGEDAATLAGSRPLAEVASLIWTGGFHAALPHLVVPAPSGRAGGKQHSSFVARAQTALATAADADLSSADLRPDRVVLSGWRILHVLAAVASGAPAGPAALERGLARAWGLPARDADIIRAVLILCADHELNVSSFTARCVASAGSGPYAVVIAGLAALQGTRHGGASARVESMLTAVRRARDVQAEVAGRLRRGEALGGFGHPLYARGDPRATLMMDLLGRRSRNPRELDLVRKFADAGRDATGEEPNLDFALAAVARVLRLPDGSPLVLFAIGRTIGWIGHAIEQYATGQLIRPRAKYSGPAPNPARPD